MRVCLSACVVLLSHAIACLPAASPPQISRIGGVRRMLLSCDYIMPLVRQRKPKLGAGAGPGAGEVMNPMHPLRSASSLSMPTTAPAPTTPYEEQTSFELAAELSKAARSQSRGYGYGYGRGVIQRFQEEK